MSLVIVVKCNDGIIVGTDSRQTIFSKDDESDSYKTQFKDGAIKVFEFSAPHNYVIASSYNYLNIGAGSELPSDPEADRYSIYSCLKRFEKDVLLKTYPHRRINVAKLRTELENFLIPYWERFRSKRLEEFQKFDKEIRADLPPQLMPLKLSTDLVVVVTGFDEQPSKAHLFVFFLNDKSECWEESHYVCRFPNKEIIGTKYGLYFGGRDKFMRSVLAADYAPVFSTNNAPPSSELLKTVTGELTVMKKRFNIQCKRVATYFHYYSTRNISVFDAAHLAELLIKGTMEHGRLNGEELVGGDIRIYTITPRDGVVCRLIPN